MSAARAVRLFFTGISALILLHGSPLFGQGTTAGATASEEFEKDLQKLVGKIQDIKGTDAAAIQGRKNAFDFRQNLELLALALTARSDERKKAILTRPKFLVDLEEARVDKQVGGSDTNAGGTTLVTKGGIPAILGFAVENGALMRTESGTTITFRGNPVGIIEAFQKQGFVKNYQDDLRETRFLRRLSFAFSFDTSRGASSGSFIGDQQQLSSYSFRVEIVNKRDPRHPDYQRRWDQLTSTQAQEVTNKLAQIAQLFLQDETLKVWNAAASEAVANAPQDGIEAVVRAQLNDLMALPLSPSIESLIASFSKEYDTFLEDRNQILELVSKGMLVTFEYTNVREVSAPDLSNFKFIAEGALWKGKVDLTANGSFTIFNSIPAGMNLKRVRDAQVSGQLDIPLGQVQKVGAFVLSFSGKYERMRNDAMMGGMMVADTKGDVGIGQIKLTIPVKGSGVKIPLSITFANRTELIKEKEVRGNIGITFDLDSIFARLKP